VNPHEILAVLEEKGAVLKGHFRLSSGRHSDVFIQKFRVFEHPRLTQALGEAVVERFGGAFDVVASPAVGAIVLGFATALAAETRFVFAERVDDDLELRRGFRLEPHERVLVVDDVVTTGASVRAVIELVRKAGANPVGAGALIDRADAARPQDLGVRFDPLVRLEVPSWEEAVCLLCRRGVALDDPGSRRLPR
jgi:orotate phosphoribosyltransferase